MPPTKPLEHEHALILRVIRAIDAVIPALKASGAAFPQDFFASVLDFLNDYVDHYHHRREEEILVPCLQAHGLPLTSGPIALVVQEHKMARTRISIMRDLLPLAGRGEREAIARFLKTMESYTLLLRNHMGMENLSFYRLADRLLSEEDRARLIADFDRIHVGGLDHEHEVQYEALAEAIEARSRQLVSGSGQPTAA